MSRLDCATLPSIAFVGDPLCISVLMWFIKWMQSNCRKASHGQDAVLARTRRMACPIIKMPPTN
jgi:hypothetical protein